MPNYQRQNRCIVSSQNKCQHETHSCNQSAEKVDTAYQNTCHSDDDDSLPDLVEEQCLALMPSDNYKHVDSPTDEYETDDDDSMFD